MAETQLALIPGFPIPSASAIHSAATLADDAVHTLRKREARAKARDVLIPDIADPARRAACEFNLLLFLETYLSAAFTLTWSPVHLRIIARLQETILHGGKYCIAAPRGTGKSAIVAGACLWAILYGHRRFMAIICDNYENSKKAMNSVRTWTEGVDILAADFPGPCSCVRALEGIWNRANAQTVRGARTHIKWGEGVTLISFPILDGDPSSGARIAVRSMEKNVRGIHDTLPSGEIIRPDLVIIDDPLSTDNALSVRLVDNIDRKIAQDALNLGGPGTTIAAFMLATCIAEDDVASRYLDHAKHPDWRGERYAYFESFPTNTALWDTYNDRREKSFEEFGDLRLAHQFYLDRRDDLDLGAITTWPERFDAASGELSAIEAGMLRFFDIGQPAFMAEYQNQPEKSEDRATIVLSATAVEKAWTGLDRNVIPPAAVALAVGIDVMKSNLFWTAGAALPGRSVAVVDYGVQDVHAPVGKIDPGDTTKFRALEVALREALEELYSRLMDTPWLKPDGTPLRPMLLAIDDGWMLTAVHDFCRQRPRLTIPVHGCGTMPNQGRWHIPRDKAYSIAADGNVYWRVEQGIIRHTAHTDAYKRMAHAGFLLEWGEPGSIALFRGATDRPKIHHSFARHIVAETEQEISPGLFRWREARGRAANHWLDATGNLLCAFSVLAHHIPAIAVDAPPDTIAQRYHQSTAAPLPDRSCVTNEI